MGPPVAKKSLTYSCADCGKERRRDQLVTKRIQFKEMGMNGKVRETRTVAWLCEVKGSDGKTCLERDGDFGREPYVDAPGTAAKRGGEDA